MSNLGNTSVRTVIGHLVSVYQEHGLEAFQVELTVILERISELGGHSISDVTSNLSRLGYKLFQMLELPESGSSPKSAVNSPVTVISLI